MTPAHLFTLAQAHLKHTVDNCKTCGGSGAIQVPTMSEGGYYVSADMASDACMPELEGQFMGEPEPDWDLEPCPGCTPVRELLEGKYGCWHEPIPCAYIGIFRSKNGHWGYFPTAYTNHCEGCGTVRNEFKNPTYSTIKSLTQILVDLDVMEGFVEWHVWQTCTIQERAYTSFASYLLGGKASAEILMTPKLLSQAIGAYLEGVSK